MRTNEYKGESSISFIQEFAIRPKSRPTKIRILQCKIREMCDMLKLLTLNSFTWQVMFVELRKSMPNTVTFLHGRLRLSHKPSSCNLAVAAYIRCYWYSKEHQTPTRKEESTLCRSSVGVQMFFLVDSGNNWSLTVELWRAEMIDRSVNR